MAIHHLPPDILTDILLKLPIETLTTAKLVNKFWFRIISSSEFVTARLKNSTLSDHRVIYATTYGLSLRQFSIGSLSCSTEGANLDFPKNLRNVSKVTLVGSCNGLVCVALERWGSHVFLWNPCTGSHNKLPPPLHVDFDMRGWPEITYGFGYDEVNDDYKVVAFWVSDQFGWPVVNERESYSHVVKVYSLKRNSWKRVEDYKGCILETFCTMKLASGKVHWLSDPHLKDSPIISFDMGSEVFGIVEKPTYASYRDLMKLDVVQGCICLVVMTKKYYTELWIQKEYGMKESWNKLCKIHPADTLGRKYPMRPCSVLPNGEILCFFIEYFCVYNPKDDSFWEIVSIDQDESIEPVTYVQSLVSPFATGRRDTRKTKMESKEEKSEETEAKIRELEVKCENLVKQNMELIRELDLAKAQLESKHESDSDEEKTPTIEEVRSLRKANMGLAYGIVDAERELEHYRSYRESLSKKSEGHEEVSKLKEDNMHLNLQGKDESADHSKHKLDSEEETPTKEEVRYLRKENFRLARDLAKADRELFSYRSYPAERVNLGSMLKKSEDGEVSKLKEDNTRLNLQVSATKTRCDEYRSQNANACE